MNEKEIKEAVAICKAFSRLYGKNGLLGIAVNEVQLGTQAFVKLTESRVYTVSRQGGKLYPYKMQTIIDGVMFFTILTSQEVVEVLGMSIEEIEKEINS